MKGRNGIISAIVTVLIYLSGCSGREITFIVASDLHFNGDSTRMVVFDTVTRMMNSTVELIGNSEGAKVSMPFGAFLTGDLTEGGTAEQWKQFIEVFGLNGEKRLQMPVFETFGNHDGNSGGIVREGIRERNIQRKGVTMISDNGLHYAIRKKGNLFIVLGSYPADEWDPTCEWCHYFNETFREPEGSLTFLRSVLEENKEGKDLPVFLFFHYGWDSFSQLWWTKAEQSSLLEAIAGTDVQAIFHGHNHAVESYKWNGIDVFISGSPQRGDKSGDFLLVQAGKNGKEVFRVNTQGVTKLFSSY
jgi:cytolysin (calcineurin-like family phosphatase)